MKEATLYQFSLCPFCSKVRSGLALKGIPYRLVEVNPRTKAELPALPDGAPRKVPVLVADGETVWDSTEILRFLDRGFPETQAFRPADSALCKRADEIEDWVDEELIKALPTVIYGTIQEASKAAAVVARSSKLTKAQSLGIMLGGSAVMYLVAKRILKKSGRKDGHAWVAENLDKIEGWLGDQMFLCGSTMTVADVAVHGALMCVEEFPVFASIKARPKLRVWLTRMEEQKRAASRGAAQSQGLAAAHA
jgi:microsomal prostaglandin-E synthase 2